MPHQSRSAIVTGSSRGIGAAIARRLARDGFAVVINASGSIGAAEKLASEIQAAGGQATAHQANVAEAAEVSGMFDAVEAAFGGIDVVVNSAGIMTLAPIADSVDAVVDDQLAVNVKGTINTMREAARRMRNGGRVITLSSSVVGLYQPTYGVYAATKAAVEALTRVFAKELRGRDITVNAVAPGPTNTALFMDGKDQKSIDAIAAAAPLERLGEPEDIASVVAFLASAEGGWINGQVLRANGGLI